MTKLDKYKGLNAWSDELIKELEDARLVLKQTIEYVQDSASCICTLAATCKKHALLAKLASYSGQGKAGSGE